MDQEQIRWEQIRREMERQERERREQERQGQSGNGTAAEERRNGNPMGEGYRERSRFTIFERFMDPSYLAGFDGLDIVCILITIGILIWIVCNFEQITTLIAYIIIRVLMHIIPFLIVVAVVVAIWRWLFPPSGRGPWPYY